MAIRRRILRSVGASLFLLALAVPLSIFLAARVAEYWLGGERRFGNALVHLHGPKVSVGLALRADSATVRAPGFSLSLFQPSVKLIDGFSLNPSGATLFARIDSAAVTLSSRSDTVSKAVPFPEGFRFPLGARAEWRALTVRGPDSADLEFREGRFRSLGAYAAEGTFTFKAPGRGARAPEARVEVAARWTGDRLHYRAAARRDGLDSLTLAGARDKADLRRGVDTVAITSEQPADWLPPALASRLPDLSGLRVSGTADWTARNIQVTGAASTGKYRFLRPCDWTFDARLDPGGGRLALSGRGGGQTFRATGSWSHPEAWLKAPEWRRCEAGLTAEARGADWKIGRFELPVEFVIPEATLRAGLDVKARVLTSGGSRIDLRWKGDNPGRLEFSGPVAPGEAWAVAWTDSQVHYSEARVRGVWENSRVRGTARFRDVLAYGAVADSVETDNEVTSSQYTLRSASIHKDGETFTGSGWVRWRAPAPAPHGGQGPIAVSLRFEAEHPEFGAALFAMPHLDVLEASAKELHFTRFPYRPLARFAAYDPRVNGSFRWDLRKGNGIADLNAVLTGDRHPVRGRLFADWTRDTLRVSEGVMASGEARVEGQGVFPLGGRSLLGIDGLKTLAGGAWRVGVDSLGAGDVLALLGKPSRPLDGRVNGALEYSPADGLRGAMRVDSVRSPALRDADIAWISLFGMGDSVSVTVPLSSRRIPTLHDTIRVVAAGFDSDAPRFRARTLSSAGFAVSAEGQAMGWRMLGGTVNAAGHIPLSRAGALDSVALDGIFSAPLNRAFVRDLAFEARNFRMIYVVAGDSQRVTGTPSLFAGQLRVPDLRVRNNRGGGASGSLEATFAPLAARAELAGQRFEFSLPEGQRFEIHDFSAGAKWRYDGDLKASVASRAGAFAFPPSPYRVEGEYENLRVEVSIPPPGPSAPPASLVAHGRVHDVLVERKISERKIERDLGALFSFGRGAARQTPTGPRRARPWDFDIDVEATGSRNRVETDVLRMNFIGDVRAKGVPPYLLVTGRVSGIQGEIGQARQAYTLRDLEVKWDNAALEEGIVNVEGEKRVRVDCRVETKQTCPFYIRVDGRLSDASFTYDTDCGQTTGEQVPPTVLITSMSRGCYAGDPSSEGAYGSAALASLEPLISGQLSRGFARGSGGFIKSTQVSGLGAIVGGDSAGLEAVSLEVESREVYRVGLKGRAGYRPETKQSSPMEYRMAAEYRPPLEKWTADSAWHARLKDRITVEAAVETRPEAREIEEERRVQQRVGLRYRYRFWDLW